MCSSALIVEVMFAIFSVTLIGMQLYIMNEI